MPYSIKRAASAGMGLLALLILVGCGRIGGDKGDATPATPAANIPGGKDIASAKSGNTPLKKSETDPDHPVVVFETSMGKITVTLNHEKAPMTVDNFLKYVNELFYNQTVFHQVFQGHGVVAGGFDTNYVEKQPHPPVLNEAHNGLKNVRGTLAMARLPDDYNSATSQFFINVADNPSLDFQDRTPDGYGYCVFGEVTEGMDVVDEIARTEVHDTVALDHTPIKQVVILSARQIR
jgi:cyclophilin family peptidyl-prolyl cis-trans isomerase